MSLEIVDALDDLARNKGIAKEVLEDALKNALVAAYKKNFGSAQNVEVRFNRDTGAIQVIALKEVVEEVEDDQLEMDLEQAQERDPSYQLGDMVEIEVTPESFGRIAAQSARQVVTQRIREAERELVYEEYVEREGEIITGIVRRVHRGIVYIDLGKTEAILTSREQIPGEYYRQGQRLKTYLVEVRKTTKGPQIILSRSHPGLLKRLFELEVPEIHDGVVEIVTISREAGARSKVAVRSHSEQVDAVGACVGPRGSRVQSVVAELGGEKIDIVQWAEGTEEFIANALSPATVTRVYTEVTEDDERIAKVMVPDDQLSLAIGKSGQNARLAAKLTGWKIDIKSETEIVNNPDLNTAEGQLLSKMSGLFGNEDEVAEEEEAAPVSQVFEDDDGPQDDELEDIILPELDEQDVARETASEHENDEINRRLGELLEDDEDDEDEDTKPVI